MRRLRRDNIEEYGPVSKGVIHIKIPKGVIHIKNILTYEMFFYAILLLSFISSFYSLYILII